MKIVSFFLLAFMVFSCSKNVNSSAIQDQALNDDWEIDSAVIDEGKVSITFTNKSDTVLRVIDPLEKRVEMQVDDGWQPIGILYCDCEAPCPNPPYEMQYAKDQQWSFTWDLKVEECLSEGMSKRTITSDAKEGVYRVTYFYQFPNTRERKKLIASFKL